MAKATKTTIDKLDDAIAQILDEYVEGVEKDVNEATVKVGKEGVKALKAKSKSTFGGSGKYAKGWKATTDKTRLGTTVTLHNTTPGLPHLLEHGHANRGGGRTPGRTHIAPVETEIIEKFTKLVKEAVQQ